MSKVKKAAKPAESRVKSPAAKALIYVALGLLTVVFLGPLLFILMNSFKGRFFISDQPFDLPLDELLGRADQLH